MSNESEYDQAVDVLNDLIDEVGTDESHALLYTLLDPLGTVMHAYEEEHHPIPDATGVEVLRYLMDERELTQSDLPEIGSQGVVSKTLSGKRELNVRQIRALCRRGSAYLRLCSSRTKNSPQRSQSTQRTSLYSVNSVFSVVNAAKGTP